VIGISLLLTIISTFPLFLNIDSMMVSGKYQWSHAWAMEMLHQGMQGSSNFEILQKPFSLSPQKVVDGAGSFEVNTTQLDYPRGGKLVLLSWPNLLLGHGLRTLGLHPLAAFNIVFLLSLSLAPFFAYLLARSMRISITGSVLSAVIYSTSPYVMGILYNGQIAKANHWCIAALIFAALNAGRGKLGYFVLLCILLPLCFSSSPYYLLFSIIPCATLFLYGWWEGRSKPNIGRIIGSLCVGIISFYSCFPIYHHFKGRIRSLLAPATGGQMSEELGIVSTIPAWFTGISLPQANGVFITGELHYASIGFCALLIGLVTLIRKPQLSMVVWMVLAIGFAMLSLGTGVQQQWNIPLPFDLILALLPSQVDIIMRYRAIIITTLGIAIVLGFSFDYIRKSFAKKYAWLMIAVCLVEWLTFSIPLPTPTETVSIPMVYKQIANEPNQYGIIEFPCDMMSPRDLHPEYFALLNQLNQRQLFYQIFHKKGLGMVDKANLSREVYQTNLMRQLQNISFQGMIPLVSTESTLDLNWFAERNFKYLIVHDNYIPPKNRANVHSFLSAKMGKGVLDAAANIWRYSLPKEKPQ
jgi:hypothetical protein